MKYDFISNQKNFWPVSINDGDCLWNQSGIILFNNKYTFERLNSALNSIMQDYEIFRCRFKVHNDEPVSYIDNFECRDFPFFEFTSKEELNQAAIMFANQFQDNELFKAFLFNWNDCSGFFANFHHLIIDGYSMPIMAEYLNGYLKNKQYMPKNIQSYEQHIQSEEAYINSKRYQKDRNFWSQQFSLNPKCSIFEEKKTSFDYASDEVNFRIPPELFSEIKIFSQNNKISIQSYFNTVYFAYIFRTLRTDFFTVGVPVLNRTTESELNAIGLYMHVVPLLIRLSDNSFLENVLEVEDAQLTLFRHQKFTQHDIKELLKEEGKPQNSLFDVVADYQMFEENDDYKFEFVYSNSLSVPIEIHLQSFGKENHNLKIRYRTSMFSEKEIQTMLNSIITIAQDALVNPDKSIFSLEMLTREEKNTILHTFNDTDFSYDTEKDATLYSLFQKTAKENAEKICLSADGKLITFNDLLTLSQSLDRKIRSITKNKKSVIAVIADRSIEMYAAIYGIIRGGNAYLPISPDYPQERIDFIIENSSAKCVVAQDKFCSLVKNVPCIDMTEFIENPANQADILPCAATAEDTAYVIYTSGSTGNPKGAKISHKSAVNRILWMHEMYPLKENDVILQKTPYTFDVSVWELFWWGMCGGKLAASKPQEHFLPAKILDEVYKNKVTHLHFVPSVFELFLNYLEAHTDETEKFNSVRYVFLSGEALSAELITRFYALYDYNKVGLHNLYGPTECAVDVTYYPCKPTDTNPVPIGKPIYNTQIYIVDKHMNLMPVGVKGELCIGGVNVGQGYVNNENLTAEKFVDNPFGAGKLYKTGDLAYFREDGEVIFCGRMDSQIKLNGQRIEISEIEAVISSMEQVETVAVVVSKTRSPEMLVAFYSSADDISEDIKEICLRKLPGYMVPAAYVRVDKLPLNQSGKLDRKLLSQRKVDFVNLLSDDTPKTKTEQLICDLFSKTLNTDNIGRNSNFFENGGTSLSMISVLSEKAFENISAAQFVQNATPLKLAELIDSKKKTELRYIEPLYIAPDAKKAFVLLPFAGGGAQAYAAFTDALKKQYEQCDVYFIRYLHSVNDCEKAAEEISAVMKDTEISIYSHCVGSALALHILSSLEKNGKPVKHYFAGASIPPVKPTRKNIWNIVPDFVLKKILSSAGAKISVLSSENQKSVLQDFRKDTGFANIAFADFNGRIKTPVSIILSKNDIFTKNYKKAGQIWEIYAEKVNGVYFIDSDSHYFQSDNSNTLAEMLSQIIE